MNSSQLQIIEQDFGSFFEVPFQVYPSDFPFVSEFKDDLKRFLSTKNPIFKNPKNFTYFTAIRNGKPVGRIVCHIHTESNLKYNWKKSYFGYFDLENNLETAQALLKKAEEFGLKELFVNNKNLLLTDPLDYFAFQKLIISSKFILTDSGGIQEESTFVGKPCLTLRPNTERPVTVTEGTNTLVPFDLEAIKHYIFQIEDGTYKKGKVPKFWDGKSTQRILEFISNLN